MNRFKSRSCQCSYLLLLGWIPLASGCGSSNASAPLNHSMDGATAAVESAGGQLEIRLNFAHADLTDDALAKLPLPATTTAINLSNTKITDEGLKHLERFADLEELNIAETQITDAGIEQLMKLPKLRLVSADQSQISRKGQLKLIKFLAPRAQAYAERIGSQG